MRFSGIKKKIQSHNQTFTSFPAWGLAVVPVGTRMGDSRIRVSLSNQGGPIESSYGKLTLKIQENVIHIVNPMHSSTVLLL
jgi:hypothetical protein